MEVVTILPMVREVTVGRGASVTGLKPYRYWFRQVLVQWKMRPERETVTNFAAYRVRLLQGDRRRWQSIRNPRTHSAFLVRPGCQCCVPGLECRSLGTSGLATENRASAIIGLSSLFPQRRRDRFPWS